MRLVMGASDHEGDDAAQRDVTTADFPPAGSSEAGAFAFLLSFRQEKGGGRRGRHSGREGR